MYLLNEIVKILSNPVWSGIGVLASVLLSVIALVLARKSPSKLNAPPQPKRKRNNRSKSRRWIDDYDPTGGMPDAFFTPGCWN